MYLRVRVRYTLTFFLEKVFITSYPLKLLALMIFTGNSSMQRTACLPGRRLRIAQLSLDLSVTSALCARPKTEDLTRPVTKKKD